MAHLENTKAEDDWRDWLRLMQTPGVGNETARKLLNAFGLPSQIFRTNYADLLSVVPEHIARSLSGATDVGILTQQELTADWLQNPQNCLIHLADETYPPALLEIPDPPVLLYAKGRVDLLKAAAIGVVGSRNATQQGNNMLKNFPSC